MSSDTSIICPRCRGAIVTKEESSCTCLECDFRFFPEAHHVLLVKGPNGEAIALPVECVKTEEAEPGGIRLIGLSGSVPVDREPDVRVLATATWETPLDGVLLPSVRDETARPPAQPSANLDAEGGPAETKIPWEDEDLDSLPPLPRRFLLHMLDRERADTEELADRVWGKSIDQVSSGALSVAINRVNEFLGRHGYTRRLEKVRGVSIVRWA